MPKVAKNLPKVAKKLSKLAENCQKLLKVAKSVRHGRGYVKMKVITGSSGYLAVSGHDPPGYMTGSIKVILSVTRLPKIFKVV